MKKNATAKFANDLIAFRLGKDAIDFFKIADALRVRPGVLAKRSFKFGLKRARREFLKDARAVLDNHAKPRKKPNKRKKKRK